MNNMNKMKEYQLLELNAKNGVRLLYEKIKLSENYEETKQILDEFINYVNKYASKKNNRYNKALTALEKYFKQHKEEVTEVVRRAKLKKARWQNFIPLFIKLHNRGYSNPKISTYLEEKYGIKISKETIRKAIKDNL